MPSIQHSETLATSENGIKTPLYFDRQVIRAEDLNLGQSSHMAEIARLRRLAGGWGVVAGLIPYEPDRGSMIISPGYGVTPLGDEIYLTSHVSLEFTDLIDRIRKLCGPIDGGCEVFEDAEITASATEIETGNFCAWLIARPTSASTDTRAGIPQGCAHPANSMMPTRNCLGTSLELMCTLPDIHTPSDLDCESLMRYVCPGEGQTRGMLPLPALPDPADNFLVVAKLQIIFIANGTPWIKIITDDRRPLLPVSFMQDWMMSCLCPKLQDTPEEPINPVVPPIPIDPIVPPISGGPIVFPLPGGFSNQPGLVDKDLFNEAAATYGTSKWEKITAGRRRLIDFGRRFNPGMTPLPPELVNTDPRTSRISAMEEAGLIDKLIAADIEGPAAFMNSNNEELAVLLDTDVEDVQDMKMGIAALSTLHGPQF